VGKLLVFYFYFVALCTYQQFLVSLLQAAISAGKLGKTLYTIYVVSSLSIFVVLASANPECKEAQHRRKTARKIELSLRPTYLQIHPIHKSYFWLGSLIVCSKLTSRIIIEYLIDYFYTISSYVFLYFCLNLEVLRLTAVVKLPTKAYKLGGCKKSRSRFCVEIYFD